MGKQYRDNEINSEGHVLDLLSAYIDKSLEDAEREHVHAHLEECADCRVGYVELQATVRMLHSMPVAPIPRAFTLTPEMAARARKTSLFERIFTPRLAPTFATGSVVTFVLLFFLFAANISSMNGQGTDSTLAFAPLVQSTDTTGSSSRQEEATSPNDDLAPKVMPDSTATTATEVYDAAGAAPAPTMPPNAGGGLEPTPGQEPGEGAAVQPPDPQAQVTPNSSITYSGTSSPTTFAFDSSYSGATVNNYVYDGGTETEKASQSSLAQPQPGQDMSLLLAAEISLLALGLILAVAAIVARRRTT